MVYGLIGYPLGHSFSPAYFADKFHREAIAARYEAFPLERIEDFPALLEKHPGLRGLNVTIPHKEAVLPYLHALHPDVAAIGAANCIVIGPDGRRTGYNTDWAGFRDSLLPALRPYHSLALILGTGGAAKSVAYALDELGIAYTFVSRTPAGDAISYAALTPEILAAHPLIINTTPMGMHPHTADAPPLPYHALASYHLLYDLVYNPDPSEFLRRGAAQGAATQSGLRMLILQAEAAWKLWSRSMLRSPGPMPRP